MGDSPFFHQETRDCRRGSVLDRILDNSKPHHQFRLLRWLALVRSEPADRLGSLATRRDLHDGSRVETFPRAREEKGSRPTKNLLSQSYRPLKKTLFTLHRG